MTDLHEFLQERSHVPIPNGDVARVKLLAKELAMGVHNALWHRSIGQNEQITNPTLSEFLENRWRDLGDNAQIFDLLLGYDYISLIDGDTYRHPLTRQAFALLDETESYNIFISYRRMDSSALALLVLARLKEHRLKPFVDMALQAGGNWHADLEEHIKACDYFIILLGKDTLTSEVTVKEINWALQYESAIIPLWHRGFDSNDDRWSRIDKEALDTIQQTNAIIVQDESASGYNTAIVELLNRFGVTP